MAGLVDGLVVGLVISFFEEVGWTGFATDELRKRHGPLATGLILGLPWGVMHLPAIPETASGAVPLALEVAVIFFFSKVSAVRQSVEMRRPRAPGCLPAAFRC